MQEPIRVATQTKPAASTLCNDVHAVLVQGVESACRMESFLLESGP